VAWYKIFGRLAAGPNVKVRLNDYYLPGNSLYDLLIIEDCQLLRNSKTYLSAFNEVDTKGRMYQR